MLTCVANGSYGSRLQACYWEPRVGDEVEWNGVRNVVPKSFLEDIPRENDNRVKPFISALDLLVGESTCPQVEGEAPEIHMTPLCVYR